MINIHKINQSFVKIRHDANEIPEKRLWKAILCQAVEDTLITSQNKRKQSFKNRAIEWLSDDSEDLDFICEMADVKKLRMQQYIKVLRSSIH